MQIYLPIAEMPVNVLVILAMGLAVGFLSGMFGVGNPHRSLLHQSPARSPIGAMRPSISRWAASC